VPLFDVFGRVVRRFACVEACPPMTLIRRIDLALARLKKRYRQVFTIKRFFSPAVIRRKDAQSVIICRKLLITQFECKVVRRQYSSGHHLQIAQETMCHTSHWLLFPKHT